MNTIINLLIQHDFLVLLISSIWVSAMISLAAKEEGIFIPLIVLSFLVLFVITNLLPPYGNWETATVTGIIPAAELQSIEMPDHTIEIWHGEKKIWVLSQLKDYLKKDKIDHMEYRHKDLFGIDYDSNRLIFED